MRDDEHELQYFFCGCRDAQEFLQTHKDNTAVIHCKAGKGRTGICIASLLLALGISYSCNIALAMFAMARTDNCIGVTIPSQRRWVQYYDQVRHLRSPPQPPPTHLVSIGIANCPAKLTPRLIFVILQRDFSKEEGYVNHGVLTASMPKEKQRQQGSSAINNLFCGVSLRGWTSDWPALPALGDTGTLQAAGTRARRIHLGRGWRIRQLDDTTIFLDFEADGTKASLSINCSSFQRRCTFSTRPHLPMCIAVLVCIVKQNYFCKTSLLHTSPGPCSCWCRKQREYVAFKVTSRLLYMLIVSPSRAACSGHGTTPRL